MRRALVLSALLLTSPVWAQPRASSPAPAAAGEIAGHVSRSGDGTPFAGATVTARPTPGGKVRRTTSAADGAFRFAGLQEGFWDVKATAGGMIDAGLWRVEVKRGETTPADLALVAGGRVRGTVVGENGAPIAGASIPWNQSKTDAQGRYELFPVPPSTAWRVDAEAPGHVRGESGELVVRAGETTEAPPLVLETAGQLVGEVRDAKTRRPLAGVAVYAYGDGIEAGSWGEGKSDASGRFRVDGLRPGHHTLSLQREGYEGGNGGEADVTKGVATPLAPLALTMRAPMLGVYANQKVFLPTQKPRLYVNAFRTPSFTAEVFAVDPEPVLARETNLEKLAAVDLAGRRAVRTLPAQPVSYRRVLQEVHGKALVLEPLPPGTYVVRVAAPGGLHATTWIQATDLALVAKETAHEVLVYACDLDASKARPGVALTAFPSGRAVGTTDAAGVARIDLVAAGLAGTFSLWATDPARPEQHALLFATGHEAAVAAAPWRVYFETDRPIYRPGQTVFYKGTVRADDRGNYAVRQPATARLVVTDAADGELLATPLTLSTSGAFDGRVELPARAALGFYRAEVRLETTAGTADAVDLEGGAFRVEEYRKPELKVAVAVDPPTVVGGAPLTATIDAAYYFGGPVAGAAIAYDVYATPASSAALFADRAQCADCWNGWDDAGDGERGYGELVLHGTATTDGTGRVVLPIPTRRPAGGEDLRYKVTARVADPTGREVEDSARALVTRAAFALDVASDRFVVAPQDDVLVRVRAADFAGSPVATPFTLRVLEERWEKGKATTLDVAERSGATATDGTAEVHVVPGRAGYLKLYALAKDDAGRLTDATQYLWSAGEHWVLREYPFQDLQIATDKQTYQPGDTARVLVSSAIPDSDVLFTIEGDVVREARVLHLRGASELLEIPIRAEHLPTINFGATQVARHRFAEVERAVPVSPAERILSVRVTPERASYHPRDTAAFAIETRDATGRGVPAEVSVAVVDEAVFGLSRELVPDVRQAFYGPRPNQVVTAYSFPMMYEGGADKFKTDQRRRLFKDTALWSPTVFTGADGTARVEVPLPDNLTTWRATARAVTADTRVGQARGTTLARQELMVRLAAPRFFVRGDRAVLRAAAHNETAAAMRVALRAELTGLAATGALAATLDVPAHGVATWDLPVDVAGVGEAHLVLDAAGGGYADGLDLTVPIVAFGARAESFAAGSTDGAARLDLNLPADVDLATRQLALRLAPSLGAGLFDALDALATYPYGCIEQTLNGFVPAAIVRQTLRGLGVAAVANAAAPPPRGQGAARPNGGDLAGRLAELQAELPARIAAGLARLGALQHEDGGWGWFEHDASHPFLTAYAVYGLALAREAGEHVDEVVLTKGRHALDALLETAADPDRRAWILFALARSGELSEAERAAVLAFDAQPGTLSPAGRALLTSALVAADAERAARSARALLAAAAPTAGGGLSWPPPPARRYSFTGSEVETTAFAALALLESLPAGVERDTAVEGALRFLAQSRRGAWWVTTKDTAAAVLAVTAWLREHPSELAPDARVRVELNGAPWREATLGKEAVRDVAPPLVAAADALAAGTNTLAITKEKDRGRRPRGEAPSRVYYAATLTGLRPGAVAEPVSAGFEVSRSYRRAFVRPKPEGGFERATAPFDPARDLLRAGERLEVHLTVHAAHDAGFVLIEDPLPSGFEVEDAFGREADEYDEASWAWWFARREVRDDRVTFFATDWSEDGAAPRELVYTIRAEVPGTKHVLPASASLLYFPEVRGASAAAELRVE